MHKYTLICFLWIFIYVACGAENDQETSNGVQNPSFLDKAKNIYKNKKVSSGFFKNSQAQNSILEELRQYESEKEREIVKPEVPHAEEKKSTETLENVLAKRLLLGREINSVLDQWLIAKLKQVGPVEKETANRGWGNKAMPPGLSHP